MVEDSKPNFATGRRLTQRKEQNYAECGGHLTDSLKVIGKADGLYSKPNKNH
jgi:hypothetical protein